MKRILLASGVTLGALVVAWMFTMGFSGWYRDPERAGLFFLVVPIQIAVLMVALRHTARRGRRYGSQVASGTVISLIAGLLIFCGSMVFTSIVFPGYFEELRAMQEQMMRQGGMAEPEVQRELAAAARNQTSIGYAFSGFLGTLVTGLVASAVIAIFTRAR